MKRLIHKLVILLSLMAAGTMIWNHTARADQTDPRLGELFGQLHSVEDPRQAHVIEQMIWGVWLDSKSPTLQLLMGRVIKAMGQRNLTQALELLHSVVAVAPDYAEGWNKRATVYFMMGDYKASISDVERTLDLEPRHFGALSGLGLIYTHLKDNAGALDAYERALLVNPHLGQAKAEVKRLKRKVKGEEI
jgi:tetratricopeptide (TPR) repeat protein